jgi:hypothetical protein
LIDDLADDLDAWRAPDIENAEAFARRIVGLFSMTQVKRQARWRPAPALRNEGGTLRDPLGSREASARARGANPPHSMRAPCSIACGITPSA